MDEKWEIIFEYLLAEDNSICFVCVILKYGDVNNPASACDGYVDMPQIISLFNTYPAV